MAIMGIARGQPDSLVPAGFRPSSCGTSGNSPHKDEPHLPRGIKRQRLQDSKPYSTAPPSGTATVAPQDDSTTLNDNSPLDDLPDDVLSIVLAQAAAGSNSPGDFINMLLTSRKFCHLGGQPEVLSRLPPAALHVAAADWCPAVLRFLSRCCQSSNPYASYALGMIAFYCLGRPGWGLRLLAQAALAKNADALYSLGIIHFNGSGGTKEHRDVPSGVLLCMQAAALGHADATRELGHCLQDGYGVERDPLNGKRFLVRANAQDTADAVKAGVAAGAPCGHVCGAHRGSSAAQGIPQAHPVCDEHRPGQPERASRWRRRRSRAFLPGQLSRCLSAPPELPSPDQCFRLFSKLEGAEFRGAAIPSAAEHRLRLGLPAANLGPAHTEELQHGARLEPQVASIRGAASSALGMHQSQGLHLEALTAQPRQILGQPAEAEGAAGRGVPQLSQEGRQHPQGRQEHGHQCFCLPAVTVPLHARSDGWVRLFMLDWQYLVEVGHMQCLCLGADEVPAGERMQCSNINCGRVELRENEFRCCSACTEARYCSRVCQAQDWKMGHKALCTRLVEMQMAQAMGDFVEEHE